MRVYVPPRPLNHDPSFVVERLGANPYFGTLRKKVTLRETFYQTVIIGLRVADDLWLVFFR